MRMVDSVLWVGVVVATGCGGQVGDPGNELDSELTATGPGALCGTRLSPYGSRPKSDGSFVYFLSDLDSLSRVPVAGGPAALVYRTGGSTIMDFAMDAQAVYVALTSNVSNGPGAVRRVAKDGSTNTLVVKTQGTARNILLEGAQLYYTSISSSSGSWVGSIHTIGTSGGTQLTLASNEDGQSLGNKHIAMDRAYLYFVGSGGALRRVPKFGGGSELAMRAIVTINAITSTENTIYFIDGRTLGKIDSTGTFLYAGTTAPANPSAISVGSRSIFVGDGKGVYRAPISGGAFTTVVPSGVVANGFAAAPEGLYVGYAGLLERFAY